MELRDFEIKQRNDRAMKAVEKYGTELLYKLIYYDGVYSAWSSDCSYECRSIADGYYALILMDVQMPRMNGYDATRQIRKLRDQKKVSIPVIAMTVNAFEEDRNEAFAAGMDEHVAKPVEIKKLMNKIVKYIRK